jgi:hypothetical protein
MNDIREDIEPCDPIKISERTIEHSSNSQHPSSHSSFYSTYRSKQAQIENFMNQISEEQYEQKLTFSKDNQQEIYNGKTYKVSYTKLSDSQDMSDKENKSDVNNNTATFNPYKRLNRIANAHERPVLESIDLNIKDFDKVGFPFRPQNWNKSSIIENLDSPNRSVILNDPHKYEAINSKEEMMEDDEVTQMLKDAGMSLAPAIELQTFE